MTQIPSEENFSRAKELARERSRNLDNVRNTVMNQFASECPLVDFYILDQIDVDFRVYVFFNKTADAEVCQNNGTSKQIIDFVYK